MPLFRRTDNVARLRDLLDRESDALTSGRLDQLATILREKQRLFEALRTSRPEGHRWAELRARAERNQHLIEAAADGIRAAIERLERISSAKSDLVTYNRSGELTTRSTEPVNRRKT